MQVSSIRCALWFPWHTGKWFTAWMRVWAESGCAFVWEVYTWTLKEKTQHCEGEKKPVDYHCSWQNQHPGIIEEGGLTRSSKCGPFNDVPDHRKGTSRQTEHDIISLGRITCSSILFWKAQGGFGNNRWLEFQDVGYKKVWKTRSEKQSDWKDLENPSVCFTLRCLWHQEIDHNSWYVIQVTLNQDLFLSKPYSLLPTTWLYESNMWTWRGVGCRTVK